MNASIMRTIKNLNNKAKFTVCFTMKALGAVLELPMGFEKDTFSPKPSCENHERCKSSVSFGGRILINSRFVAQIPFLFMLKRKKKLITLLPVWMQPV